MVKLIAISGKIGSGKDSLADMLIKELPISKKYWFAYKLKLITKEITACSMDDVMTQDGKNRHCDTFNRTYGQILQELGTEVMRNHFDINVWVKSTMLECQKTKHFYWYEKIINRIKSNTFKGRDYTWIIPDMRFQNEFDAIKQYGGITIRINGDPSGTRSKSTRNLEHVSETALDNVIDFHFIIENNGTLDDLRQKAKAIINLIK